MAKNTPCAGSGTDFRQGVPLLRYGEAALHCLHGAAVPCRTYPGGRCGYYYFSPRNGTDEENSWIYRNNLEAAELRKRVARFRIPPLRWDAECGQYTGYGAARVAGRARRIRKVIRQGSIQNLMANFDKAAPGDGVGQGHGKWFNSTKGYGFITLENGGDAFCHASALQAAGHAELPQGATIVCDFRNSRGAPGRGGAQRGHQHG